MFPPAQPHSVCEDRNLEYCEWSVIAVTIAFALLAMRGKRRNRTFFFGFSVQRIDQLCHFSNLTAYPSAHA